MAQLVVRNLDNDVKERLRARAVRSGRSLEAEVRQILRSASYEVDPEPEFEDANRASSSNDSEMGRGSEIAALSRGQGFSHEDVKRIEAFRQPPSSHGAPVEQSPDASDLDAEGEQHRQQLDAEIQAILDKARTVEKPGSEVLPPKDFATAVMERFRDNPLQPGEIQEIRGSWTRPAEFD